MARILASWGCDVILAARRTDRLESLAQDLGEAYKINARAVSADLAVAGGAATLFDAATAGGDLDILINNAGFGDYQVFAETPWERHAQMLQLNVVSLAELTHRFCARALGADRQCYVLNVGSVVSFMPMPYFANYCGTKAYVRNFTESLAAELAGTNIRVTCVSPGATKTEFTDVSGQVVSKGQQSVMMSSERVARIGLHAMLGGKRQVVTGISNKIMVFFRRLVPRRLMAWSSSKVLGKPHARAALPEGSK